VSDPLGRVRGRVAATAGPLDGGEPSSLTGAGEARGPERFIVNVVIVEGNLSRTPERRTLASGSTLLALEVTVRDPDQPTETVPVAWFDPPAAAAKLADGAAVMVVGRVRRRFFRAGGATASRTEVVADTVVASTWTKRRQAALDRVRPRLAGAA